MIRTAAEQDLDAVMGIWLRANLQAHDFIPPAYWRGHFDEVRAAIAAAEVYVYDEDAVLGFVGLAGNEIAGIFVEARARDRGVGGALIRFLQARKPRLSLHVYEKNERAVAFYRKHGFRVAQRGVDEGTGQAEYQMVWEKRKEAGQV